MKFELEIVGSLPDGKYEGVGFMNKEYLDQLLKTMPPDQKSTEPHELSFPFNIRRAVGFWKLLFLDGRALASDPARSVEQNRGAYLVEGPGHCAECHSGRNVLGAIAGEKRFAGGIDPSGRGWVPNITPHADGLASWTAADHESLLETGLSPDGVPVGGAMSEVVASTSKLTVADRKAMAVYLAALPPRPGKKPAKH